jgi:methionine-rich copper-binding protein CopC
VTASRGRRRLGHLTGFGLLTALLVLGMQSAASAHSVLLSTTPAESAQIAAAPPTITMTFNEQPRGEFSDIHITGPDGARRDSAHVKVLNDTITEDLGGTRPAGKYVVDWRVISADGHPVSGQFSFTAKASAADLGPRQPDAIASAAAKKDKGSNAGVIVTVVVIVVLVAGVGGFVLMRRKPHPIRPGAGADHDHDDGD